MATIRPEEISAILQQQIAGFRTEVELEETTTFLDKVYKGNVGLMISNLIGSKQLTDKQLEELRRIIEEG